MRRQRWFELHDQPWFPAALRDLVTEALEAVWNANRTYHPIAGRLREAVQRSGADRIIDLCSGGGGPWLGLYDAVADGRELQVCLTDLYPNARVLARSAGSHGGVTARMEPVDARSVPAELRGFRTMFSSFHHFDPEAARAMLADAFHRREGIAVFEAARRNAPTLLAVSAVPLLAMRAAATQPFRWRRVLWTYCLPVVPLVLWVDGVLSCLRSYSEEDLRELTQGLSADDYRWQVGEEHRGLVTIRYLVGTPLAGRTSLPPFPREIV
jgi:hypothetical protein